jgi:butyryl-CoA dehydrogenase
MGAEPEAALANATPYLQAFGHVVLAWLWLDVARMCADPASAPSLSDAERAGKLGAMRWFYAYELPKIDAWLLPVAAREAVCRELPDDAF